jgi:hypothetical protein
MCLEMIEIVRFYRRDGGVLLAVNKNLDRFIINVDNVPGIQQIVVLSKYNTINILLGCVYIPPST